MSVGRCSKTDSTSIAIQTSIPHRSSHTVSSPTHSHLHAEMSQRQIQAHTEDGVSPRAISSPSATSWSRSSSRAGVRSPMSIPDEATAMTDEQTSTLEHTGICARLAFTWIAPLLRIGKQRGWLELDDLQDLHGRDSTAQLSEKFNKVWSEEVEKCRTRNRLERWKSWRAKTVPKVIAPSLFRSLWKLFGWRYAFLGVLKLLSDCLMFSGPVLLGYLVSFVESYDHADGQANIPETRWHGYAYAGGLVLGVLLNAIASTQYNFAIRRVGLYLRACMVSSVYRKSLTISNTQRSTTFSTGNINNIMSLDTDRVSDVAISIHEFWSLPIQIILALYLLYQEVSYALLAGLTIVLILIPINGYLTKRIQATTREMMHWKDQRLSLVEECLRCIRNIKFLSWESSFHSRILALREKEVHQLGVRKYLDALCVYFWATTPLLVSLATFTTYSYFLKRDLTASKVFSCLALFNILIRPLNAFPWVLNGLVEGKVSIGRIYKFLSAKDQSEEQSGSGSGDLDSDETDETPQDQWTTSLHPHRFENGVERKMGLDDDSTVEDTTVTKCQHDPTGCAICLEGDWKWHSAAGSPPNASKQSDEKKKVKVNGFSQQTSSNGSVASSSPSPTHIPPLALSHTHLHIPRGQFVAICGPVGAGKSALLLAMLGELAPSPPKNRLGTKATRALVGRVAYVSQESWLPNCTLKESILFHSPEDPVWYQSVLHACALEPDLLTFPSGDATEVGEGGVNLSGGQRMRLALARACYARADILLMDDPLASVDSHVAAHLVKEVLSTRTGLLRESTRVLVTHHPSQVRGEVGRVWSMQQGRIVKEEEGTLERAEESKELSHAEHEDNPVESQHSIRSPHSDSSASATAKEKAEESAPLKGFLTTAEARARGSIRSRVLSAYLSFIGYGLCMVIVLSMFLMQGSRNAADAWLSLWVEHAQRDEAQAPDGKEDASDAHYYLRIFAYIAAGNSVAALFRAFIFAYGGLVAARASFQKLLDAVLYAPVAFFDANPVGRILNRFSTDTYSLDENIPFQGNIFLAQAFMLLGSIIVIATVVPAILVILPFLALVYYHIQASYRSVSRELRRLDSTTRSPIYSNFSETLTGANVIRAFHLESIFQQRAELILDQNQKVQFSNLGIGGWLNLRLQGIGVIMITVVSFLAIVSCLYPISFMHFLLNPSMIGLGIAYALPLTDTLNGLIGSFTDTEKEVISVERTVEYIEVKSEEEEDEAGGVEFEQPSMNGVGRETSRSRKVAGINEDLQSSLLSSPSSDSSSSSPLSSRPRILTSPSPSWPERGTVEFQHVTMAYRADLEPALKDVSFSVAAGQRVGIVGRTGGGKSSLFQALFRMRDLREGRILIDGVDIATIPRRDLRARLSIIPQSPVLFSGTIRSNLLPPVGVSSAAEAINDDAIWRVLQQCHVDAKIRSLEHGLSTVVTDSTHLSVGERQLLSFARAILKGSKIIVLDEATASVDAATSAHIHALTLNLPSTVMLIAHRLESVMSCDTVIVMEDARVRELDTPTRLADDPRSVFARMRAQAPEEQAKIPRPDAASESSD